MIDYEFTIKRLERELAHAREMQKMQEAHLDTHDRSIEALGTVTSVMDERLEKITIDLEILTGNVKALVEALLRQPHNGQH